MSTREEPPHDLLDSRATLQQIEANRIYRICAASQAVDDWAAGRLNAPTVVSVVSAMNVSSFDERRLQPMDSRGSTWSCDCVHGDHPAYLAPASGTRTAVDLKLGCDDPVVFVVGSTLVTLAVGLTRQLVCIGLPASVRTTGFNLDELDVQVRRFVVSAPRLLVLDVEEGNEERGKFSDVGIMRLANTLADLAPGGVQVERLKIPKALTLLDIDELREFAFAAASSAHAFSWTPTTRFHA